MNRRQYLSALSVGGAGIGLIALSRHRPNDPADIEASVPESITDIKFSVTWAPSDFTEGITISRTEDTITVAGGMYDGNECLQTIALTSITYNKGTAALRIESKDDQNGPCDTEGKTVEYTSRMRFADLPDEIKVTQQNHVGHTWEQEKTI